MDHPHGHPTTAPRVLVVRLHPRRSATAGGCPSPASGTTPTAGAASGAERQRLLVPSLRAGSRMAVLSVPANFLRCSDGPGERWVCRPCGVPLAVKVGASSGWWCG